MKMHLVISIAHLEPATPDPLNRKRPPPGLIIDKDNPITIEEKFNIDRIITKEIRKLPRDKKAR